MILTICISTSQDLSCFSRRTGISASLRLRVLRAFVVIWLPGGPESKPCRREAREERNLGWSHEMEEQCAEQFTSNSDPRR